MQVITVISTYNQPRWLKLALEGWLYQTKRADLIVIADDGSDSRTAEIIQAYRNHLNIVHVWHEDKGFRKTEILNKSIQRIQQQMSEVEDVQNTYCVFTDGDCIPRNDFLQAHVRKAKRGRFLSGGYHKLSLEASNAITIESIASQVCFKPAWLKQHGMSASIRNLKLKAKGKWSELLNMLTTTRPTFNGHNSSVWLTDILNANGFDTRMKYGGEDREFGERLENAGVKGLGIRYSAVCLHLEHSRSYINTEDLRKNDEIRFNTHRQKLTVTEFGIN